jgi:hypothetical protein
MLMVILFTRVQTPSTYCCYTKWASKALTTFFFVSQIFIVDPRGQIPFDHHIRLMIIFNTNLFLKKVASFLKRKGGKKCIMSVVLFSTVRWRSPLTARWKVENPRHKSQVNFFSQCFIKNVL